VVVVVPKLLRKIKYLIIFFSVFINFSKSQVLVEAFQSTPKDSFTLNIETSAEPISLWFDVNFDDYILLHSSEKSKVYLVNCHNKSINEFSISKSLYGIIGFGVLNSDTIYVVFSRCGRRGTDLLEIDLKNHHDENKKILSMQASNANFGYINQKLCLLLSEWNNFFEVYEVVSKELKQKIQLPNIITHHSNSGFSYPYARVHIFNDTIFAFNYSNNPTIYFLHSKKRYIVSSIANPNQPFKISKHIFDYIEHEIPVPMKLIEKHLKNYRYYWGLKSFEYGGRKYFYQFSVLPDEAKEMQDYRGIPHFLTVWNENFEVIKNLILPNEKFFIDFRGNLFHVMKSKDKLTIFDYGVIIGN